MLNPDSFKRFIENINDDEPIGRMINYLEQRNGDQGRYKAELIEYYRDCNKIDSIFDCFIPRLNDNNYYWGILCAITTNILQKQVVSNSSDETLQGDFILEKQMFVKGNLIVNGDFKNDSMKLHDNDFDLIVAGNLIINGNFKIDYLRIAVLGDVIVNGYVLEESSWSFIYIGGQFKVENFISLQGELYCIGQIFAKIIDLYYNHGHAQLLGGFKSLVFHEFDHDGSKNYGNADSDCIFYHKMRGLHMETHVAIKKLWALIDTNKIEGMDEVRIEEFDTDSYDNDMESWILNTTGKEIYDFIIDIIEQSKERNVFRFS